jgi:Tol biopolymer transport system component
MVNLATIYRMLLLAGFLATSGCGGSDAPPAGTPPSDGAGSTTTRVSVGSEANNSSYTPSISSDGRFIAFASDATNLVGPNDTNGVRDVFVRDTVNSTTSRVSLHNDGNQRTDPSSAPSISSDGQYVAFQSDSALVADDTNGVTDVFVRDTVNSTTIRVSLHNGGNQRTDPSSAPSISSDGQYVAFQSDSPLTANDTNGVTDVFIRDTVNNTTTRVSLHNDGNQRTDPSSAPSISSDGQYVAFQSDSPLTANDTNGVTDVFVRDTTGNTTMRASVSTSGMQSSASSLLPSISADGNHISFESNAPNLVTDDFNGVKDIFVRSQ